MKNPLRQKLLKKRANIVYISENIPFENAPKNSRPPEEGHPTSKISLGVRHSSKEKRLASLIYSPSLHGMMDDERGLLKNSEIIMFELEFRNYFQLSQYQLHKLTLISSKVMSARDIIYRPLSFEVEGILIKNIYSSCHSCLALKIDLGVGYSRENKIGLFSAMFGGQYVNSEEISGNNQIGLGILLNYLKRFGEISKFGIFFKTLKHDLAGNPSRKFSFSHSINLTAQWRYSLSEQTHLIASFTKQRYENGNNQSFREQEEINVSFGYFF